MYISFGKIAANWRIFLSTEINVSLFCLTFISKLRRWYRGTCTNHNTDYFFILASFTSIAICINKSSIILKSANRRVFCGANLIVSLFIITNTYFCCGVRALIKNNVFNLRIWTSSTSITIATVTTTSLLISTSLYVFHCTSLHVSFFGLTFELLNIDCLGIWANGELDIFYLWLCTSKTSIRILWDWTWWIISACVSIFHGAELSISLFVFTVKSIKFLTFANAIDVKFYICIGTCITGIGVIKYTWSN